MSLLIYANVLDDVYFQYLFEGMSKKSTLTLETTRKIMKLNLHCAYCILHTTAFIIIIFIMISSLKLVYASQMNSLPMLLKTERPASPILLMQH